MPPTAPSDDQTYSILTRSSGGVGWQVDISKLVSIATSLGIEGLKRLQPSGLDLHTIACLTVLSEVTPACIELRNSLHEARRGRRKQSWWISLVEFGSGTN